MMPIFPDQHFLFLIFVFTTALKQSGYSLSFKDYFILLSGTCCQLLISFFLPGMWIAHRKEKLSLRHNLRLLIAFKDQSF